MDLADFTVESERLGGQLVLFLVEKAGVEAEASGGRVVVECKPNVQLDHLRVFLNDFMQKFNLKGKVKARGKTLTLIKSRGKPFFAVENGVGEVNLKNAFQKMTMKSYCLPSAT